MKIQMPLSVAQNVILDVNFNQICQNTLKKNIQNILVNLKLSGLTKIQRMEVLPELFCVRFVMIGNLPKDQNIKVIIS